MLKLYNTLTRDIETFKPIETGLVKMYTCGPTVYDFAHIGNLRAYVFVDLLRRYLEYEGYNVDHIMNLTDVDDKTIKKSREQRQDLGEFTEFYIKAFLDDIKSLNIQMPDKLPKATDHIKEMVELIKNLMEKGYAYKADDGSVYFNISAFKKYGKLAQIEKQNLKKNAGERLNLSDEYDKEDANDFVLWKSWTENDGDVYWDTEIGKGRPGWHVECSAMSMKYLGDSFDIHTGGVDLIFPHHTNEIAQTEAITGKTFVNYWLHNNYLLVEGKKMSKSEGNFYTLRDIVEKGINPLLVRFILLRTHYRKVLDFSFDDFEEVKSINLRLLNFLLDLKEIETTEENSLDIDEKIEKSREDFVAAMDDDLNISSALAALFWLVGEVNSQIKNLNLYQAKKIIDYVFEIDQILGFITPVYNNYQKKLSDMLNDSEIKDMLDERQQARENKNFEDADKIREKLQEKGLTVKDSAKGQKVRLVDMIS